MALQAQLAFRELNFTESETERKIQLLDLPYDNGTQNDHDYWSQFERSEAK